MGLDGFSMSNLGLHRNLTTAQLSNDVEATAKMALENQLPDVDGVGKKEKAGKKDPEAAFNPAVPFISDKKKKKDSREETEEDTEEKDNDTESAVDVAVSDTKDSEDSDINEDIEIEEPKYLFKISDDDMIEIYDTKTNKVVKKISAQEAAETLHNFTKLPSVFFNKDI